MERSSPLAAMHPPTLPGWGSYRSDVHQLASSPFGPRVSVGPNSFNFKDLSMKRSSSDYFSLKPIRGSSPTASLAADLSQNFHIDQSPQLVTPRRCLFNSTWCGAMGGRETTTTPPLPSSSPGPGLDPMDISPLPHKLPRAIMNQLDVGSPTTVISSTDTSTVATPSETFLTVPADPQREYVESTPRAYRDEMNLVTNLRGRRRRPSFPRPSLVRTKGHSTNMIPLAPSARGPNVALPTFTFGAGPKKNTPSSLAECFVDSPPKVRAHSLFDPPIVAPVMAMAMARPRPSLALTGAGHARNGSPLSGHVRKQSVPAPRPRKLFRRSLSMFEHPDDVIKEEQMAARPSPSSMLPAIMDLDEQPPTAARPTLPHFIPDDRPDGLPRITKETLIDVLDGRYQQHYDETLIVDCRFEYEYEGGHIDGAINYNDKELLARRLFDSPPRASTLLVFHCEYSAHRAPIMAEFIRGHDRSTNDYRYPQLTYPEVYILDGGYSSFFGHHRIRCVPPHYVEMRAKEHADTCEREMGKLRHRKKLSRAQTFAFGQHPTPVDDSPTAPQRVVTDTIMSSTMGLDRRRGQAHRMASY
ncbi:MAG: hypothetical protein M1823_001959 [Watsoniomyces obsoletus]|nr:MAG: hypothetical protein M1823_001959 [Watsoniomyces obsoletus]